MFKIRKLNLKEKTEKMKSLIFRSLSHFLTRLRGSLSHFLTFSLSPLPIFRKMFRPLSHFPPPSQPDTQPTTHPHPLTFLLASFLRLSLHPLRTLRTLAVAIRDNSRSFFIRVNSRLSLSRFSLGLDIGTSSIKIARLLRTRRGVKLLNFWEKEIPREQKGEAGEETIARTIAELLSRARPAPFTYSKCQKALYRMLKRCGVKGEKERVISSLPASSSVVKRLSLPFKGERKIRQVIRYEMEPFLPFSLEEAAIDFYITDDHLPDRTLVLAFAINKRVIEKHLKILNLAGIKPEVVDLDSTSLFNVYFPKKDKETIALINLGAGQTIIDMISEGRLLLTRSIFKAGDDITQALAERLGIGFREAEKLKRGSAPEGALPRREGLDEEKLKAIEPVLDEIMKEIEHTLSSFLASYPNKKIEKILLTGGSACLSGIVEYFQKSLNIETSLFNPFIKLPPAKLFSTKAREFFIPSLKEISCDLDRATLDRIMPFLSQAMGIALCGMARTKASLNFIREEKPLIKRLEEARPLLKPAAILLISILLLGLLDFYLHLYLKNKRSAKLKKEIRLVFNKTFPEVTNIVNPLVQMKDGLEKREEDLALSPREFSSLSILREIFSLTPEDLGISLEDLSIDWDETRIRGRTSTPDFSLVDRFKKALEGSDYFTEVKVSDAHLSRKGESVEFRMTIKYGK